MDKAAAKAEDKAALNTAMSEAFSKALRTYIHQLDGEQPCRLYEMAMSAVEDELFRFAITHCGGNRSKAAKMLGISRTTLARKTNGNGNHNHKANNSGGKPKAKPAKPAPPYKVATAKPAKPAKVAKPAKPNINLANSDKNSQTTRIKTQPPPTHSKPARATKPSKPQATKR